MAPKSLYQIELETIAKSRLLFVEDTDMVLREIGSRIAACLGVERVNVWLFSETRKQLVCIANYDVRDKTFSKGEIIYEAEIPHYYSHLLTDEILVIHDVRTDKITSDLKDNYCADHEIFSMMDVPIYIEGKLSGVMCYEKVGTYKKWSEEEQFFVLAINQLVSLVLETRKRREAQVSLQKALEDKERLLLEMHHRIKNNLSTLVSLLRVQVRDTKNQKFVQLANDFENRIFSIAKIHEQLYTSRNYLDISLKTYIEELVNEFQVANRDIEFALNLMDCRIATDQIVPLGLICNEIITNSIKYAFEQGFEGKKRITIDLNCSESQVAFRIADNGIGFDYEWAKGKDSLGVNLIEDLVDQIDGELELDTHKGASYSIRFSKD